MDGLKNVVHMYSGYYPATRKREMLPFAKHGWKSMLSEKEADTEILNSLTCMQILKNLSLQAAESRKVVARGLG